MNKTYGYLVRYAQPQDLPQWFRCMAENSEHAEEQAINAWPRAMIICVIRDYSI